VHGQHGHARVDRVVVEGQRLGGRVDRRGQAARALRAHRARRLDREHAAILGLVGAGARAHVDHRPRAAERGVHARRDAAVGPAMPRVLVEGRDGGHHAAVQRRVSMICSIEAPGPY